MKVKPVNICLTLLLLTNHAALAKVYLYDLGTKDSEVWPGFKCVTVKDALSATTDFGWQTTDGIKLYSRSYKEFVDNPRRGRYDPPPIWTNSITEDSFISDRENTFYIRAKPDEYEVYVVCGTSAPFPAQFFDFTVQVGSQKERVQIEGSSQFRSLRFKTVVGKEPLAVRLQPNSKWCVNAIMAWPVSESGHIEQTIVAPFEEWTYRMPPPEWAKWKEEPEPLAADHESSSVRSASNLPNFVNQDDRHRGFVVFSRPYLECIYPHTPPRAEDVHPELQLSASLGEYEPTNFIVLPLQHLTGAKVTVSDLGPVSAHDIDVRRVRYMRARPNYISLNSYRVVPDVLEHFSTLQLNSGENMRFLLTVHVPEAATPGTYTGKVQFECSTGKAVVPIQLRILPIRLRDDPEKTFGIYYQHPYDEMASATDEISREYFRRKAELEHQDMVAHGTRNIVLSVRAFAANSDAKFKFDSDLLAAKLDLWKKYQFRGPIVMSIGTSGIYATYMGERLNGHLRDVKEPPEEFFHAITAMVQTIENERQKRGWPEFLYYPVDEPGGGSASVDFMVKVLRACKAAHVRTYLTADPTRESFKVLRPYVDVWCTQPFSPDHETVLAEMKARPVEYWCYPNHVAGENDHTPVAGARMTYGFGFWRSGFRALIPWIYSASTGDPFNYLDGGAMDFFNRHEPDGTPMPVFLWEAYREGYDDYRYVYTLEQLIAEAKTNASSSVRQAARTAEQELGRVWDAIPVQEKYKYNNLWAPEEFDRHRSMVATQIIKLQDALQKVKKPAIKPLSQHTVRS